MNNDKIQELKRRAELAKGHGTFIAESATVLELIALAERATEAGTPAKATIACDEFNAHMQAVIFTGATDADERHKEAWQDMVAYIDQHANARAEDARRGGVIEGGRRADIHYAPMVDDLAALVRQLVRSLKKANPGSDLPARAMDYLKRKDLQGSPLREGEPVAEAAAQADDNQNLLTGRWPNEEAMDAYPATAPTAQPTLPDDERAAFEDWLDRVHGLDSEWMPERNCFKDYPAHLAFQAFKAGAALRQPGALPDEARKPLKRLTEEAVGKLAREHLTVNVDGTWFSGYAADIDAFALAVMDEIDAINAGCVAAKQAGKEA